MKHLTYAAFVANPDQYARDARRERARLDEMGETFRTSGAAKRWAGLLCGDILCPFDDVTEDEVAWAARRAIGVKTSDYAEQFFFRNGEPRQILDTDDRQYLITWLERLRAEDAQ